MHLPATLAVILAQSRSRALGRARKAGRLASRQIAAFRQRASILWELKTFVRESLLAVLLSLVIVTVAGVLFGSLRDALIALPGLTLLVPGALAMRGNIFASLGARLGSALHTGELPSRTRDSPRLREEVLAAVVQTLLGSQVLALLGRVVAMALGFPTVSLVELSVTAVVGSLAAGAFELWVTVEVAITAHRKGWDPDNVTAPIISAVADLVSIPFLLGSAFLVVWLPSMATQALFALLLAVTVILVIVVVQRGLARTLEVLWGSTPIILPTLAILVVPALLLEDLVHELVSTPVVLVMLPPFLAIAGNLGAILASRLSSAAHLGVITMHGPPDPFVYKNLVVIMLLSVLNFTILGLLVHGLSVGFGMPSPGLAVLITVALVGGMAITGLVSLTAYQITVYTFRRGDDPDNVVIPVITSMMDAVGTGLVLALFFLLVF